MIALELVGHVAIPYSWKEFVFHRGCEASSQVKESKEGRQTVFYTPLDPWHDIEEQFGGDLSKSRQVHHTTESQKTLSIGSTLARAQEQGLQFW